MSSPGEHPDDAKEPAEYAAADAHTTRASAPPPNIRIVADDREPADAVAAVLRRRPDVDLCRARLAVGDYQVDDQLLVERKTLPDLVQSIKDGRLFKQALLLVDASAQAVMVLEGRGRDLAASRMSRQAIQGALTMLTLEIGLPILRAADPAETAALMLMAARQRRAIAAGDLPRHGRRPTGKRRLQSHILQGLPGIGPARARHLIQRFGSVRAVMTAPVDELAATPGIGSDTAKRIRRAVEEPRACYAPLAKLSTSGRSPASTNRRAAPRVVSLAT